MERLADEGLMARLRSGYRGAGDLGREEARCYSACCSAQYEVDGEQGVKSLETWRWEGGVGERILSRRRANYTSDREQGAVAWKVMTWNEDTGRWDIEEPWELDAGGRIVRKVREKGGE